MSLNVTVQTTCYKVMATEQSRFNYQYANCVFDKLLFRLWFHTDVNQ